MEIKSNTEPVYRILLHSIVKTLNNVKDKYNERVAVVVVVVMLFYVHGKHLRSCRDGQLT